MQTHDCYSVTPDPPTGRPFTDDGTMRWVLIIVATLSAALTLSALLALGWFARGWIAGCS